MKVRILLAGKSVEEREKVIEEEKSIAQSLFKYYVKVPQVVKYVQIGLDATGLPSPPIASAPHISNVQRDIFPFLDAAQAAGVEQVVFLSLIRIEQNQQVPHYKGEQYLWAAPMGFTFLHASFFMQTLSGTHWKEIRDHDEIFLPVGCGKTSFIDVRDIAAVVVKALTEPGHEIRAYNLTGPEVLDYYRVAEFLSEVLGKNITYATHPSLLLYWSPCNVAHR